MNDKTAHAKLKKLQESTNGYRNSRREKNERHEKFNEAMMEMKKLEARRDGKS